jgi:protein-L-isoaspartate(D-aspartate) O-methyltransferase
MASGNASAIAVSHHIFLRRVIFDLESQDQANYDRLNVFIAFRQSEGWATHMDYSAARTQMVENQIRTTDVTSHSVLSAFLTIPREMFVADRLKPLAYIDTDLEIAPGRYIMQPSPLAKLAQLAGISKADSVLEIGAGNGYATAILAEVSGKVTAVETDAALAEQAKSNLAALGATNVAVITGDATQGYKSNGPYDVIFLSGSAEEIPQALFSQLKEGGRLVAVVGRGPASPARVYLHENNTQSERFAFNTSVKPLSGFARKADFVF